MRDSNSVWRNNCFHQDLRLDRAALGNQDDADIFGDSSRTSSSAVKFLLLDQLRDAFDELGLLHLIGNLVDDDLIGAARAFLAPPARAQPETAAPGA